MLINVYSIYHFVARLLYHNEVDNAIKKCAAKATHEKHMARCCHTKLNNTLFSLYSKHIKYAILEHVFLPEVKNTP